MAEPTSKTTKKTASAAKPAVKAPAKKAAAKTATTAVKKTATVKTTTKAAAPKPVVAKKPAAPKKAAAEKKPAARRTTPGVLEIDSPKVMIVSDEQRYRMVAEAAYYRAESNHFRSDPIRDWVEAEKDIAALLSGGTR